MGGPYRVFFFVFIFIFFSFQFHTHTHTAVAFVSLNFLGRQKKNKKQKTTTTFHSGTRCVRPKKKTKEKRPSLTTIGYQLPGRPPAAAVGGWERNEKKKGNEIKRSKRKKQKELGWLVNRSSRPPSSCP